MVGDIFDLWIGQHQFFIDRFKPLIEVLKELKKHGVDIHVFEGNHDLYLRDFWAGELGFQVYEDASEFELSGLRVRVEHGDLINPDDRGYLFLRWLLRTPLLKILEKNLPDRLVTLIGEKASSASRDYTSTRKELPVLKIKELIRSHAESKFSESKFDLIVTGHVHVQDDFSFAINGQTVRSVNLGSWFTEPMVFQLSGKQAKFINLAET